MPADRHYQQLPTPAGGLSHGYGERVHLLSYPYPMALLTELSAPQTHQPHFNHLVERLYDWMMAEVAGRELVRSRVRRPTRMGSQHPEGVYDGQGFDRAQHVAIVALARAGILPAMRCFEALNHVLDPAAVRQDHVFLGRRTDDKGRVVGVDMAGSKIGGPVNDALVLLPDPMGATGRSLIEVMRLYSTQVAGTPRKLVAMHLIVTPEYLKRVTTEFPEAEVYAIRLDRGLSPEDVLATRPGERWDEERGLNHHQYIVPGAGGLGELMNNAWV